MEEVLKFLNEDNDGGDIKNNKKIDVKGFNINTGFDVPLTLDKKNPIKQSSRKISKFSNNPSLNEDDLSDEDQLKIKEIVGKTLKREGFLAFTFSNNIDEQKTMVGVRIDRSAKGNWILAKEELLYELPLKYSDKLEEFVKSVKKTLMENN